MFDKLGQPTGGYGQYSPFKDNPKAPGAVPEAKPQDGMQTGGGTPNVPTDPTLSGWRTPNPTRMIGAPHGRLGITDGSASPLQQAIGGAGSGFGTGGGFSGIGTGSTIGGGGLVAPGPPNGIGTGAGIGGAIGGLAGGVAGHGTASGGIGSVIGGALGIGGAANQLGASPTGAVMAPSPLPTGTGGAGGYNPGNPPPFLNWDQGSALHPQVEPRIPNSQQPLSTLPNQGTPQPNSGSGNIQADWQNFLSQNSPNGTYARTHMPEVVQQFNAKYGTNAQAGNPNARGLTDTVNFGQGIGDVDVLHGGDDAWQWFQDQGGPSGFAASMGKPVSTGQNPLIAAIMQQLAYRKQ